jgi:hypothetical protein
MPASQKKRLGSSPQPQSLRNGATVLSTTDHIRPTAVHAIRVPTRGQTKKSDRVKCLVRPPARKACTHLKSHQSYAEDI